MNKLLVPLLLLASGSILAQEGQGQVQARGVNPADIDNRVDLIAKLVMLDGEGDVFSLTGKFDKKVNSKVGLNFELPVYTRLDTPGFGASGNGDLFARVRYITQKGRWSVGGSAEVVLPVASSDALGSGKYQLNVALLAVRPVNRRFMAAFALKQVTSVAGDSDRNDIRTTEVRVLPIFPLDNGWALVTEYRRVFSHESANPTYSYAEGSLSKQLNANWNMSGSYSRTLCQCSARDDGAVGLAIKYFF